MNKPEDKRTWVWWSDERSVREGTVSVLAIAETIAATAVGVWLWFHIGLYPLLLTSAVMAFLTMLRSEASIELGVRWFTAYEEQFADDDEVPAWKAMLIALLTFLAVALATSWLVSFWMTYHSGWALFWRSCFLGLFAMNFGFTIVMVFAPGEARTVSVAMLTAALLAAVLISFWVEPIAGLGTVLGSMVTAIVATYMREKRAAALLGPGLYLGIYLRVLLTRAQAVMYHFDGDYIFDKPNSISYI